MNVRILALMLGVAIASVTVLGPAIPSSAQVVVVASACTGTTATFVQAVGPSRAPVLVPVNVPVTECTLPRNVRVILPAFQVVGPPPASIIVPSGLPVASCGLSAVVVPTVSPIPVLQVLTVSGSPVTVLSPATVVAPLVTCF